MGTGVRGNPYLLHHIELHDAVEKAAGDIVLHWLNRTVLSSMASNSPFWKEFAFWRRSQSSSGSGTGGGGGGGGGGCGGGGGGGKPPAEGGEKDSESVERSSSSEQDGLAHACPVDREQLGRNTWTFLHTMAAYVPEKPTQMERRELEQFMGALSKFYPCHTCALELRRTMKSNPPDVRSRHNFSQWMCRLHNDVNVRLGKPEFDCSKVDERWKEGWKDGSCD